MCHFSVLTTFWCHLWSITEQTHGNIVSSVAACAGGRFFVFSTCLWRGFRWKFWTISRFTLKQLDHSLSLSMRNSSPINFPDSYWLKLITWRDNVHPRRDIISPSCPSEKNTRMDSCRPRKYFSKQATYRKSTIEIVLSGFCLFSFSNFTFRFDGFHRKKLKIIRYDFWPGARKKISWWTIKTIERLGTIGLIVAPWKFDLLKGALSPEFSVFSFIRC